MSAADRRKWETRYRDGAYASRTHPSPFLARCASQLTQLAQHSGRALDLACGAGRNALYLSHLGFAVDAVDISRTALDRARATPGGTQLRWIEHDLDTAFEPPARYDAIVNIRFVHLPLLARLIDALRPGGALIVEQHLRTQHADICGPRNPAFRVAPGALAELAAPLRTLHHEEGIFDEPDGSRAALARLMATRPATDHADLRKST